MLNEKTDYSRNKLLSALLKIGHGDLSAYVADGLLAAKTEPELLAHLIAWNHKNGKVRDSKVAFPVLSLRHLGKSDAELATNALAAFLMLAPRDMVRAYDFNKSLVAKGEMVSAPFHNCFRDALRAWLEQLERNWRQWDRVAVQHRRALRSIYKIAHKKRSERADALLFHGEFEKYRKSLPSIVHSLRSMPAAEAAGTILQHRIPFEVAVGAVAKAKDPDILLALIEGMTGNQLVTNTKWLEKMGVNDSVVLKSAFQKALARAKGDKRMDALKAGRAAEAIEDQGSRDLLVNLQREKTSQLKSIEGDWLVLGDKSGSMHAAVELAKKVASLIAERVSGRVYLIFFDTSPTVFNVTGKSYDEILADTKRVTANGGTSIGTGVEYLAAKGVPVDGIAICSDGGDNAQPFFHTAYQKYCAKLGIEPTVYFFQTRGDAPHLLGYLKGTSIQIDTFDLTAGIDYYALPNLIQTLRTNRFSMVDEIMESRLLTMKDALSRFERKETI